jgi:hypothetical protein
LLLSVQRALLGAVPPELRGVTVAWEGAIIRLRFYLDGPVSDEDRDAMQVVGSEVIADFPDATRIEEEILRRDAPQPMECLEAWAYYRRE